MKLEPEDFPLIVEETRIYTQRRAEGQVLVALDAEMARDVAARLNRTAGMAMIPHLDMRIARAADIAKFLGDTEPGKR